MVTEGGTIRGGIYRTNIIPGKRFLLVHGDVAGDSSEAELEGSGFSIW